MIIAERKPIDEIYNMITGYKKILIVGCGTCVTVCFAGGEKEVSTLASLLKLKSKMENVHLEIGEVTITRQCENEWVASLEKQIEKYDAVLSLGCGIGVQYIADRYRSITVLPGLNTNFLGGPEEQGIWSEKCAACGNCILDKTGGICPIARCSKNLLNGPCGGTTSEGKCEVNSETDCAWYLIHKKLKELGKLDMMKEIQPPKDWSTSAHGGPRKIIREDLTEAQEQSEDAKAEVVK